MNKMYPGDVVEFVQKDGNTVTIRASDKCVYVQANSVGTELETEKISSIVTEAKAVERI